MFDPADPITIMSFLSTFETAYDANDIQEGEKMWLFQYYVMKTPKVVLTARLTTKGSRRKNRGKSASYPKVVKYLLLTYETEEVITEADGQPTHYRQPDSM